MSDPQWLRFQLGSDWFGLPVASVWQIAPLQEVHPVPGAPDGVRGLVEIQGRILTVLDPARLFGIDRQGAAAGEVAIVLNPPHQNLALAIAGLPEVDPAGDAPTDRATLPAGCGGSIPGEGSDGSIRELRIGELLAECGDRVEKMIRPTGRPAVTGGNS